MTEEEHDYAVELIAERILRRLDTVPIILGNKAEISNQVARGIPSLVTTIPFSALLTVGDVVNALHESLRDSKTELAPWGWDDDHEAPEAA